jgi:hypothetical protein
MILTCLIACVWLVNGLFCKALDLVPRHRAIVARILGEGHAKGRTIAIGCLETAMAAWIVSGVAPTVNAWTQIALGLALFWMIRLLLQFFGYSPEHWRGKKFETLIHVLFSMLWLYLTVIFLVASGIFW